MNYAIVIGLRLHMQFEGPSQNGILGTHVKSHLLGYVMTF